MKGDATLGNSLVLQQPQLIIMNVDEETVIAASKSLRYLRISMLRFNIPFICAIAVP